MPSITLPCRPARAEGQERSIRATSSDDAETAPMATICLNGRNAIVSLKVLVEPSAIPARAPLSGRRELRRGADCVWQLLHNAQFSPTEGVSRALSVRPYRSRS